MNKKVDSTDIRRKMIVNDAHYHAEKLGFGGHGTHEGWIKAEEAGAVKAAVSAETRQKMIAVAAYYLAERRGFADHCANEDWMKAVAEIDVMLHVRSGNSWSPSLDPVGRRLVLYCRVAGAIQADVAWNKYVGFRKKPPIPANPIAPCPPWLK